MTDFETWGPPEPVTPPSCTCCRTLLEAPDPEGWMRCPNGHGHFKAGPSGLDTDYFTDLASEAREDALALRDLEAVRAGEPTRYGGAL